MKENEGSAHTGYTSKQRVGVSAHFVLVFIFNDIAVNAWADVVGTQ